MGWLRAVCLHSSPGLGQLARPMESDPRAWTPQPAWVSDPAATATKTGDEVRVRLAQKTTVPEGSAITVVIA